MAYAQWVMRNQLILVGTRWSWACWISKLRNHPQMLIFFAYRNLKEFFFLRKLQLDWFWTWNTLWEFESDGTNLCRSVSASGEARFLIFISLMKKISPICGCDERLPIVLRDWYLRYSRFLDNFLVLLRLYFILSWMATFFSTLVLSKQRICVTKGIRMGLIELLRVAVGHFCGW